MENTAPPPIPRNTTPHPKRRPWKLYLIVFVGIILIIAFLLYVLLLSSKPQKTTREQEKVATGSAGQSSEEKQETVWVNAPEGLNLREEASTDALITLLLPHGTELKVISQEGEWYFVEAQTKGFVKAEFVTKEKPSATLLTFSDSSSAFKFLYPGVYKVTLTKAENVTTYNFTGNESFGGFKVETTDNMATLGNYALKNYPQAQKSSCEPVRFGTQAKECEKVVDSTGTTYLLLVNTTMYKINYLKTEGGLLTDINNLVFYSLYFE